MGFVILVETEDGEPLNSIEDPSDILRRLIPENPSKFPLMGFIDPYGDTVFNRRQVERLLEEWTYVENEARTPEEKALVTTVRNLATRVTSEPHLYLRFQGE